MILFLFGGVAILCKSSRNINFYHILTATIPWSNDVRGSARKELWYCSLTIWRSSDDQYPVFLPHDIVHLKNWNNLFTKNEENDEQCRSYYLNE